MERKIAVLGGGSMGTACAQLMAEQPEQSVTLWMRDRDQAEAAQQSRQCKRLPKDVALLPSVTISNDIEFCLHEAQYILIAIPSAYLRTTLEQFLPLMQQPLPVISVMKGLEFDTQLRPCEIIEQVLGPRGTVAIGGPSHAEEIAYRLPTSVVAASRDLELAKLAQQLMGTERFRVYTNTDQTGVEYAGALKNVIGIAAGICDGLGFGDNAKAALMTRGQVEMMRFGEAYGAEPTTFSGLAGYGDLVTTCISPYGRNREVGVRLGQGESLEHINQTMAGFAEGIKTVQAVKQLAENKSIDMPISLEVYDVLFTEKSPEQATANLMSRPFRSES